MGDRWIGGAMNLGRVLWLSEVAIRPELATGGVGSATHRDWLSVLHSVPGVGTFASATSGVGRFVGAMSGAFALADSEGWVTVGVRATPRGALRGDPNMAWPELPGDVLEWYGPGPDRVHAPREAFERLFALRRSGRMKVEPDAVGELEALIDARLAEENAKRALAYGAPLSLPQAMRTAFYALDPLSFDINSGSYAQLMVRPAITSLSLLDESLRGQQVPVTVAVSVYDAESAMIAFDATKVTLAVPSRVGVRALDPVSVAWPELNDIHLLNYHSPEVGRDTLRAWSADPRRIRAKRDVVTWLRRRWYEGVEGAFEEVDEDE